jgi:ATP-dependent helicase HepA
MPSLIHTCDTDKPLLISRFVGIHRVPASKTALLDGRISNTLVKQISKPRTEECEAAEHKRALEIGPSRSVANRSRNEASLTTLQGFIVKHTYRGLGKIQKVKDNYFAVEFLESGDQAIFERNAFEEKELKRFTLPLKSICLSDGRSCVVEELSDHGSACQPKKYGVTFDDDGLRSEVSEVALTPTGSFAQLDPIEKLKNQDQGSYSLFGPRENLIAAINQQLKSGNGLRALLSSRIDLRPHQAFVAGVILLDQSRRYLLADEVGLGKTIEAGIVIHDLLISKPDANILILCPGALTQQWLCELYSKFSGQIFRMLEMMEPESEDWDNVHRLIASFSEGGLRQSKLLLEKEWDLVVVDEVHHLLSSHTLYDFVHQLSQEVPSVLLLSAIPAKRREDEFLRLLALLEPERYTEEVVLDKDAFNRLFDAQRAIGRKLRLIRRRLDGIGDGSFTRQETLDLISELTEFSSIASDVQVSNYLSHLVDIEGAEFCSEANQLLHHIGDTYRINRRILRNRRQRLIEDVTDHGSGLVFSC